MKSFKPSRTFIVLVCAVVAAFYVVVGYHKYNKIRAHRNITRDVLTNQKQTEHFHIYSNFDSATVDYYGKFFEGFFDYFNREYFAIGQKRPLKVYLFKDSRSYIPYAKSIGCGSDYGFYMGLRENTIVVNHKNGLGTATHELVHHFIATSFPRRPSGWVNEGIATFFEKFIGCFDNQGNLIISFGYFSNWRFPIVKTSVNSLDLSELISAEEPDQCAARSIMLYLHKKKLFKEFVKQIAVEEDDCDGSATLQKVCGRPISEIEKDWKGWIKSQPVDEDVKLVESAFVLPAKEWRKWWRANQDRLYWSTAEQIYRVRKQKAEVY